MFKIISEAEKHFQNMCCQAWLWISYLNHQLFHYLHHQLFSTQKCLALALALVDFNIFRIFVMIMLLNTTSLLIVIKLLVYLFAWKSMNNLLHLDIFLNCVCVQFWDQVKCVDYQMSNWRITMTSIGKWNSNTV